MIIVLYFCLIKTQNNYHAPFGRLRCIFYFPIPPIGVGTMQNTHHHASKRKCLHYACFERLCCKCILLCKNRFDAKMFSVHFAEHFVYILCTFCKQNVHKMVSLVFCIAKNTAKQSKMHSHLSKIKTEAL